MAPVAWTQTAKAADVAGFSVAYRPGLLGLESGSDAPTELASADLGLPPENRRAEGDLPLPEAPVPQDAEAGEQGKTGVKPQTPVGPDGRPIRPETGRIFGIFPNFVAVSGGTKPKPAGWKTDFHLANKQAYDYSSFGFLLISSGFAYAEDSHPSLNTVNGGDAIFWAYLWRGFLDKTDGTYQGTFFFPALLHEDTRYYAMGTGPVKKRLLHAVASIVVAHNYDGKPIFNLAGQAGRAGAQAVSTTYYPAGSESFGVLAQKFAYSNMRNVIYAVVREFSPDAQARVHIGRRKDTP